MSVGKGLREQFQDVQRLLSAMRVVDIVLQLHDAPGAVCCHEFGTAVGNVSSFSCAYLFGVFIVINGICPAESATGCGILHLYIIHLWQGLEDFSGFLGNPPVAQMTGIMIGHFDWFFCPWQSGQLFRQPVSGKENENVDGFS